MPLHTRPLWLLILLLLAGCAASPATPPTPTIAAAITTTPRPAAATSHFVATLPHPTETQYPTETPQQITGTLPAPTPTVVLFPASDELPVPSSAEGIPLPPGAVMQLGYGYLNQVLTTDDLQTAYFATTLGVAAYHLPDFNLLWYTRLGFNVSDVSLSPDGQRLAAYLMWPGPPHIAVLRSTDGSIVSQIIDPEVDISPNFEFGDFGGQIRSLDWALGSQRLLVAYTAAPLYAYDTITGAQVGVFERAGIEYDNYDHFVTVNADGSRAVELFGYGIDSPPLILDTTTLEVAEQYPTDDADGAAWHPTNPDLLTIIGIYTASVYNVRTHQLVSSCSLPREAATGPETEWSPDGEVLVTYADDPPPGGMILTGPAWDQPIHIPGHQAHRGSSFHPQDHLLRLRTLYLYGVSNTDPNTVLFDYQLMETRARIEDFDTYGFLPGDTALWGFNAQGQPRALSLNPDGTWTNSASDAPRPTGIIQHLSWLADGQRIMATPEYTPGLFGHRLLATLWDTHSGQPLHNITLSEPAPGALQDVVLLPDGKVLAVDFEDWAALFSPEGKLLTDWVRLPGDIVHVAPAPDGVRVAYGGYVKDHHPLHILRLDDFSEVLVTQPGNIEDVAWSPGGTRLAAYDAQEGLFILDTENWEIIQGPISLERDPACSYHCRTGTLAWSDDGWQVALTDGPDSLAIVDLNSNAVSRRLEAESTQPGCEIASVDWAGNRIAASYHCGMHYLVYHRQAPPPIILWDATTGEQVAVLRGHNSAIPEIEFSPDGSLLASASHDGTVLIWEVP